MKIKISKVIPIVIGISGLVVYKISVDILNTASWPGIALFVLAVIFVAAQAVYHSCNTAVRVTPLMRFSAISIALGALMFTLMAFANENVFAIAYMAAAGSILVGVGLIGLVISSIKNRQR